MSNKVLELRRKVNADSRIEAKVSDSFTNGEISGYAAIWDLLDLDGDIIRKGAFKRAIDNQIAAGTVPFMVKHFKAGGDVLETIGVIVEAREDEIGFWIRAELDGADVSQQVRQKTKSNPKIFGMSVGWIDTTTGFKPIENDGFEYTEMNLKEVTITVLPAQQATLGFVNGKDAMNTLQKLEERIVALECKAKTEEEITEEVAETVTEDEVTVDTNLAAELEIARGNRERELENF